MAAKLSPAYPRPISIRPDARIRIAYGVVGTAIRCLLALPGSQAMAPPFPKLLLVRTRFQQPKGSEPTTTNLLITSPVPL
jgi:hypothetical protein